MIQRLHTNFLRTTIWFIIAIIFPASKVLATCDENTWYQCGEELTNSLNLPQDPNYIDLEKIAEKLSSDLHSSITGFENMCKVVNGYVKCITVDTFDICISVENVVQKVFEHGIAVNIVATIQQLKYTCGLGYDVFHENYNCINNNNKTVAVLNCTETFSNILSLFLRGNILEEHEVLNNTCNIIYKLVMCRENVFKDCGKKIQNHYCNMMNQGYRAIMPECYKMSELCAN